MKRMLINATQEEELRMAMVDGQRLYDLNIELPSGERKKANIYKGKITRLEPSLEAAFVNYGAERHGFLPLKEISSEYFIADLPPGTRPNIREVLKEGQDIVVQIDKEERGNKGAALTTFVSLAGRFIVLKPNKPRSGGVSRRIVGDDRDLARQSLHEIAVPEGMSVIVRTAGIDRSAEELQWDLENLLSVWEAIKKVVVERPSPFLIYREGNAVIRALRDYLTDEIGEILIDDEKTYNEAREFLEQVMPQSLRKLKHYTDAVPLFTRFQIESQIESAFAHSVTLPSGGSLVIDHTEALVSIDINSARATKGGDIEATALNTNLEAADEVARQLRLRDLGGLVVIDFIDMSSQKNQRAVENRLREAVRQDRARVQIGKISRFGLLEMSRQRLRPSLGESSYLTCPRCSGIGNIRSVESLALAILRIIGEEARKERTAKVIAQLPVEVATYLLNEKRSWVQNLESRNGLQVVLIANPLLETPHYQVRRVRDDQVELPENSGTSYKLAEQVEEPDLTQVLQERKVAEPAAVATMTPSRPAPVREEPPQPGLLARFVQVLFGRREGADDRGQRRRPARRGAESRSGQRSRRRAETGQSARKRGSSARGSGERKSAKPQRPARGAPRSGERNAERNGDGVEARPAAPAGHSDAAAGNGAARSAATETKPREDAGKSSSRRRSRGGRRRKRSAESGAAAEAGGPSPAATDAARPGASEAPAPGSGAATAPAATPRASAPAAPERQQPVPERAAREDTGRSAGEPVGPRTPEPQEPAPQRAAREDTGGSAGQPAEPRTPERQEPAPERAAREDTGGSAGEPAGPRAPERQRPAPERASEIAGPETPERRQSDPERPAAVDAGPGAPERQESRPERPEPAIPGERRANGGEPPAPAAESTPPSPAAPETRPGGGRLLPWEPVKPAADAPASSEPRETEKHASES